MWRRGHRQSALHGHPVHAPSTHNKGSSIILVRVKSQNVPSGTSLVRHGYSLYPNHACTASSSRCPSCIRAASSCCMISRMARCVRRPSFSSFFSMSRLRSQLAFLGATLTSTSCGHGSGQLQSCPGAKLSLPRQPLGHSLELGAAALMFGPGKTTLGCMHAP